MELFIDGRGLASMNDGWARVETLVLRQVFERRLGKKAAAS